MSEAQQVFVLLVLLLLLALAAVVAVGTLFLYQRGYQQGYWRGWNAQRRSTLAAAHPASVIDQRFAYLRGQRLARERTQPQPQTRSKRP